MQIDSLMSIFITIAISIRYDAPFFE